jgi:hypothetical protein
MRVGQGMTSIPAIHRAGQITVKMQEERSRHMPLGVCFLARFHIRQRMTAIEHPPVRTIQVPGKFIAGQ